MYVRLTTYDIDANYKKNAKSFAEIFQRRLQNYDGFISVEYFYNLDLGIAKSLSKWKSKEQANKALKDFSDSLKLAAQSFGSGEYSTKVLKMYKVAA
jgi:heme-degrading monooxygenase HmoA